MKTLSEFLEMPEGVKFRLEIPIKTYSHIYKIENNRLMCKIGNYWSQSVFDLNELLNCKIEIIPKLTDKEREWLKNVISPFSDEVKDICITDNGEEEAFLQINLKHEEPILFPVFEKGKYYKNLQIGENYTLADLGLKKYMMTIKEFWKSKEKLFINCKTEEQANIFCKASNKLGKKWCTRISYLFCNNWDWYKEDTCYTNKGTYCSKSWYQENGYKVLNFEDIDWKTKKRQIYYVNLDTYSFRVIESRRSVSLYANDTLLKRVYCHEDDEFDWKIGLGIALQRTVYKDNKDVLYLSKILKYKNMALFCLNKFCGYDLTKLEQKVANRKKEDKLIKF